jgi:hypothetical protein
MLRITYTSGGDGGIRGGGDITAVMGDMEVMGVAVMEVEAMEVEVMGVIEWQHISGLNFSLEIALPF